MKTIKPSKSTFKSNQENPISPLHLNLTVIKFDKDRTPSNAFQKFLYFRLKIFIEHVEFHKMCVDDEWKNNKIEKKIR